MAVVLVPPTDVRRRFPLMSAHPQRWLAALLVVAAVVGALFWVVALSPAGFERLSASGGARAVTFGSAGEYAVVERTGDGDAPAVATVVVQTLAGVQVPVQGAGSGGGDAVVRNLPLFPSWEVARFTIDEPGDYTLFAVRAGAPGTVAPGELALAPVVALGWWGSWWGLATLAGVPLVAAGLVVGVAAGLRRRTARVGGVASGSLGAHGRT